MLLAAVVIGITYTAYSIIVRSYLSYKHKNEDMMVLFRVDELLKKDFARADTIWKSDKGIKFKDSTGMVNYEVDSDYIVRTSTIIDTFKVKIVAESLFFENQPLTELSAVEELNRTDELKLVILFQDEQIPYHYHKTYSSANLIQRNINALN